MCERVCVCVSGCVCVYIHPSISRWLRQEGICLQGRTPSFCPWLGKTPCRRARQPPPASLPGEPRGRRRLAGCVRGAAESELAELLSPETLLAVSGRLGRSRLRDVLGGVPGCPPPPPPRSSVQPGLTVSAP